MKENFPDHLKAWIAENLAKNCQVEDLVSCLLRCTKISESIIRHEIELAAQSPYTQGAKKVGCLLAKREWLLKTLDENARLDPRYSKIDVLEKAPNYKDFTAEYLSKNRPVLLKGAIKHWKSANWTINDLKKRVGHIEVQIQHGRESNQNFETERHKHNKSISMNEFLDLMDGAEKSNDFYMTAYNASQVTKKLYELVEDYENIADGYIDMSQDKI
jgi:hypothetical protein